MRKKTSPIWVMDKDELELIVKKSNTLRNVLNVFGIEGKGGNYRTLKQRLDDDNIDYSHIALGMGHNKGKIIPKKVKPLNEVMTENSTYSRSSLKIRLLKEGVLKNECSICGLNGEWKNKKLTMILDHINGVSNDHRLANLRMVCPNCNSQLDTHCGKHKKRKVYNCVDCGKEINKLSTRCNTCSKIVNSNRPDKNDLVEDLKTMPIVKIGRKYGVSDNGVRKWCQYYHLPYKRKEIKQFFKNGE